MSHNLDVTDGKAAFAGRQQAWHALGDVTGEFMDAAEALERAHLSNWDVRKAVLSAIDPETGLSVVVPNKVATVRDNPVTGDLNVLGVVGPNYEVWQNEEHLGFLQTLVDSSGAHIESAGAIDGGRRVFVTMALPDHINVGGVDVVENKVTALTSHDGSLAFTLAVTPITVVCANTMSMVLREAGNEGTPTFSVRHTPNMREALHTEARQALDMTFRYLGAFEREVEALISTTMSDIAFEQMIVTEFGVDNDAHKAAITRSDAKIESLLDLWENSPTIENKRRTAWGALSALTEYDEHLVATRAADDEARRRAERSVFDGARKRTKQLAMVKSYASV